MDVIKLENKFEVADRFREDDTPMAEKLNNSHTTDKDANWCVTASPENKENIGGKHAESNQEEPEVLPTLDLDHELSNFQLLGADLRNDLKESPLKQSGYNDLESDAITSTIGPMNNQGQEDCEHNSYSNKEPPKGEGLQNRTAANDSDSLTQEYLVGINERDNSDDVENEKYNSQKSKSLSHDVLVKENSGDTIMCQVKESVQFREEVVGRSGNRDSEMKYDYYYAERPTSDNEKIVEGDDDAQEEPVSPKEHMSMSPERDISLPSRQEKTPAVGISDRRSPYYHSSPNQNQSPTKKINLDLRTTPQSESSPSTSQKISTPGRLTNQDSCCKANSPKEDSDESPRKSHCTANSPPVRSQRRAESPRESHRKGRSHKHMSKSPRRRESSHRNDRSTSRSPVRRNASGHSRSRHDRSRSRSPRTREHRHRSPRRRSPRRRSPATGYRSHRQSPRRRPWPPPSHRKTGVGRPGRNLFVAGFSFTTTERDLERKFSRFGCVTDVRVVRNTRTGDSRGFGFLSLEKDEDADAAIRALDQTEWNGRIVLVEKSKSVR